jgi:rhodanese-related sulfurtransferase
MVRLAVACLVLLTLVSVHPAPADDPEVPEKYMSVDQVNALVQQNKPVTFIDVRPKEQFDELHIRGAVSIPLKDLSSRLASISKEDFLVLY